MRRLMIAAVAVAGMTVGGQGVAQAQQTGTQFGQGNPQAESSPSGMTGQHRVYQEQSVFESDNTFVPSTVPAPRFDRRAMEQGTGGSGMVRSDTMEVQGIVRSVSDKGMTLSTKDRIVTLHADPQAVQGQDSVSMASLKVGDEVRASYQFNAQGEKIITNVAAREAAHAKKKK